MVVLCIVAVVSFLPGIIGSDILSVGANRTPNVKVEKPPLTLDDRISVGRLIDGVMTITGGQ